METQEKLEVEQQEPPKVEPAPARQTPSKPPRSSKVMLGPDAVRGLARPQFLAIGFILLIFGAVIAYVGNSMVPDGWTKEDLPAVIMMIFGILMVFVGIGTMAMAWVRTMETIYLRGGYCQITDERCMCNGGCNKCVFALKYIEFNNEDDTGGR